MAVAFRLWCWESPTQFLDEVKRHKKRAAIIPQTEPTGIKGSSHNLLIKSTRPTCTKQPWTNLCWKTRRGGKRRNCSRISQISEWPSPCDKAPTSWRRHIHFLGRVNVLEGPHSVPKANNENLHQQRKANVERSFPDVIVLPIEICRCCANVIPVIQSDSHRITPNWSQTSEEGQSDQAERECA